MSEKKVEAELEQDSQSDRTASKTDSKIESKKNSSINADLKAASSSAEPKSSSQCLDIIVVTADAGSGKSTGILGPLVLALSRVHACLLTDSKELLVTPTKMDDLPELFQCLVD